jgi:hypothetical protein
MTICFNIFSFTTISDRRDFGPGFGRTDIDGGPAVRWVDLAGYGASLLVFMTFYMKDMIKLRSLALCSNVAFLFYAFPSHLLPILALHGALIPINICRLVAACRENTAANSVDCSFDSSAIR